MGKGDTSRPFSIDREKYDREWNRIFGYKVCETCNGTAVFIENIMVRDSESVTARKVTFKRACLACHGKGRVRNDVT